MKQTTRFQKSTGFTLIELLTVIAIIGVLAAILVPTVGRVRDNARRTQARATFTSWSQAIEMFRQEYGFWPNFSTPPSADWSGGNQLTPQDRNLVIRLNENATTRQNFVEFLTGYQIDGSELPTTLVYRNHPNRKRIRFYSLTENDYIQLGTGNLSPQNIRFVDSYENDDIIIVMDGNQNGVIALGTNAGTYGVTGNENPGSPVTPYDTRTEVRAGVLIYSGGRGGANAGIARENIIRSW